MNLSDGAIMNIQASHVRLSPPVRSKLVKISHSQIVQHRKVFRAEIILRAASGESNAAIARAMGCTEKTARKWRNRFASKPNEKALNDSPRTGRPAHVPTEIRCEVIKLACKRPEGDAAPFRKIWTAASLRQALMEETNYRLSETEIRRILNDADIHPHRIRMWLHSPDPNFREKVESICKLYTKPPQGAKVLCVDEKSGMQALQQRFPLRLARKGRMGRREFEYVRHGTQTLIAALEPASRKVFGQCLASRKEKDLIRFMNALARRYPQGDIYIIWDNLNIHHGWRWIEFNRRHHSRFHFVWTPVHASWVNQIEIWFSILQRRILKHGDFHSVQELASEVDGFMKHWNRNEAHPFHWKFRGRWEKTG